MRFGTSLSFISPCDTRIDLHECRKCRVAFFLDAGSKRRYGSASKVSGAATRQRTWRISGGTKAKRSDWTTLPTGCLPKATEWWSHVSMLISRITLIWCESFLAGTYDLSFRPIIYGTHDLLEGGWRVASDPDPPADALWWDTTCRSASNVLYALQLSISDTFPTAVFHFLVLLFLFFLGSLVIEATLYTHA